MDLKSIARHKDGKGTGLWRWRASLAHQWFMVAQLFGDETYMTLFFALVSPQVGSRRIGINLLAPNDSYVNM